MIEVVALSLTILLLCYCYLVKNDPLASLPGPKGIPFLGNIFQFNVPKPHLLMAAWAKQYGGMFKIRFGSITAVVITDPKLLHEVTVTQGPAFSGRPIKNRYKLISLNQSGISATDAGPAMKNRRKVMQAYLNQHGSERDRLEEITMSAITDMIHKFQDIKGSPLNVIDEIYSCFSDIIAIILSGDTLGTHGWKAIREHFELLKKVGKSGGKEELLDIFPFLCYFGNDTYKKIQEVKAQRRFIIRKWMRNQPTEGFIYYMQQMSDTEKEQNYMESENTQEIVAWDFLIGGMETSTSLLCALFNVLCQVPELQEKLQLEVKECIGDSRKPAMQDRHSMPYHQATLHELNRFASIISLGIPHKAVVDAHVNGVLIPKDTLVILNLWGLHHDEQLWDEPFEFRPERFLDSAGDLVPADHPNRKHMLGYSAGIRGCPGKVFAMSHMFLVVASIMQRFTILPEMTISEQPSMDPRDLLGNQMLRPAPYKVRFVPN